MTRRGAGEEPEPGAGAGSATDRGRWSAESEAPTRSLLTLRLGEARFGLWIDEVLEIVDTPPISRLPLSSDEVAGVTSVRGDVIPVLDLGVRLLGVAATRPGRLVLVRRRDGGAVVGLLVDGVETLLQVRSDQVREPPSGAQPRLPPEYVTGVVASAEQVVTILHIGRATAPPGPTTDGG